MSIGSYPFLSETGPNTNLVVRSRDPELLAKAAKEVADMVAARQPAA